MDLKLYSLHRHKFVSVKERELNSFANMHENKDLILLNLLEIMLKDIDGTRLSIGFRAPQFVYGELKSMREYYKLFSHSTKLGENSVFCDLGSGLGKSNLVVATMFPVSLSIGIEVIPKLYHVSLAQQKLFEQVVRPLTKHPTRLSFLCGNVLENTENWLYSDVVFVNSLTWKKKVLRKIRQKLELLKPGTEIFSSTVFTSKFLLHTKTIDTEMNWGKIPVYLYVRIPN